MRLLLDTHIFLWAIAGAAALKASHRRIIADADEVFVSAASIWEASIKVRLGKLQADPAELANAIGTSGFSELPVRASHAAAVARLALHHNDPFDRLLVAQALLEPLRLMTVDVVLAQYSDLVMVV